MKNWWVHPRLRKRGMTLVGWSSRGWDTVARTPLMAAARIMRDLAPGVIVLVHEGEAVSKHRGVEVLEQLLPRLTQEGYRCVIPGDEQLR
jgi:peptidoglycan/xylan/chitin deacetylase (PgdA/CDA1 family)